MDEGDDFEGTIKKVTKATKCFKGENSSGVLYINVGRVDDLMFYGITITDDLGCLLEYNGKASIELVDGTIIEGMQISDTDCDSDFATAKYLPLKRDDAKNPEFEKIMEVNYEKLKTTPIENIRIYGGEYYNDYIPDPRFKEFDGKDALIKHFQAIK